MYKPGTYESMRRALVAVLLHHGGQVEIDLADLGEAILATEVEVVVERTAKGAVIRMDQRSPLFSC